MKANILGALAVLTVAGGFAADAAAGDCATRLQITNAKSKKIYVGDFIPIVKKGNEEQVRGTAAADIKPGQTYTVTRVKPAILFDRVGSHKKIRFKILFYVYNDGERQAVHRTATTEWETCRKLHKITIG